MEAAGSVDERRRLRQPSRQLIEAMDLLGEDKPSRSDPPTRPGKCREKGDAGVWQRLERRRRGAYEFSELQIAGAAVRERLEGVRVELEGSGVRVDRRAVVPRAVQVVAFALQPCGVALLNVQRVELGFQHGVLAQMASVFGDPVLGMRWKGWWRKKRAENRHDRNGKSGWWLCW